MLRKIRFGDDSGREPRVPIPNTNVKPSSADGTWTEGSWESRTSPSNKKTFLELNPKRFFCLEKRVFRAVLITHKIGARTSH